MFSTISKEIKEVLASFPLTDTLIINGEKVRIRQEQFIPITASTEDKPIAFVDGGQAEIISAGNFSLHLIRTYAVVFCGLKKVKEYRNEFYLFTKARWMENDIFYESRIFSLHPKIIDEHDLLIASHDAAIRSGTERAPITKVANMARRFAELALAATIEAEQLVLDGTLEKTFPHEEKYLERLPKNTSAVAKTSALFTIGGNSPQVVLNKISPEGCWSYTATERTSFVKLHPRSGHVFRFEGDKNVLGSLVSNSNDALFLGYPYGLIFADAQARVSNEEKKSLAMRFLLDKGNKEIAAYLQSMNAHEILDRMSF